MGRRPAGQAASGGAGHRCFMFLQFPRDHATTGKRGAGSSGDLGLSHSISQRPSFLTCNWVTYKWVSARAFPDTAAGPEAAARPASCSGG